MPTDDPASRRDLAATAAELKEEVAALKLAVTQLNVRTGRAERASTRTSLAAVVLLVVVGLLGWLIYTQAQTSARLEQVVDQQQQQTNNAFCPFYALVLGSYAPNTRLLNPDGSFEGSDRQRYIAGFDGPGGLRSQYAALPCTGGLIPPRTGS